MIELSKSEEERAVKLHKESIVVDTHCDTLMKITDPRDFYLKELMGFKPRKLGERSEKGHIDLPKLIEGGIGCQTFAMWGAHRPQNMDALRIVMLNVDTFFMSIEENKDKIIHVRSYNEIIEARKAGRIGALLSMEGSEALLGEVGILRVFYRLGVRMLSFCWNWRTQFADGLNSKRAESKLTDSGIEALEEMHNLGMLLDVSHLSDTCFRDIVDNIKDPFIASHSNCRAICDHPRNLTDDMLRAIAKKDGVIGVCYEPSFIRPKPKQGNTSEADASATSDTKATVEDLADHIDHIVDVVGPDHVGLGSDFDGIDQGPVDLEDVSKVPNITRVLVKRGYSDENIKKILGENHLRVFKEVLH